MSSREFFYDFKGTTISSKMLVNSIDALKSFKKHYEKKFNFSKLMEVLELKDEEQVKMVLIKILALQDFITTVLPSFKNDSEAESFFSIILRFQDVISEVFPTHFLRKTVQNGNLYLVTEKKVFSMSSKHKHLLSDVIYTFLHVKKGEGFDLNNNGSEFAHNVRLLVEKHPYFFEKNGNTLTYPSELGQEAGNKILELSKANKEIKQITLRNAIIEFD
jgi:hypothetical protein